MREVVEKGLASAARAAGLSIQPEDSGGWSLSRDDGTRARLSLDSGWLCLEGPVEPLGSGESWWERWLSGGEGRGPGRLTTSPGSMGVQCRAEVATQILTEDLGAGGGALPASRIGELVGSFFGLEGDPGLEPMSPSILADLSREIGATFGEAAGAESIGAAAHTIGLPGSEKRSDRVSVWSESGGCRLALGLGTVDPSISASARDAIALLLLTVAGMVRLVRAGVTRNTGESRIWVECSLRSDARAPELDQALGALATARSLSAGELEQLLVDRIAGAYLAIRIPESTTNPQPRR